MTLPDEQVIAQQIAVQFQADIDAMTGLHDAVVGMFGGRWRVTKPRGVDRIVVYTVAGLLTKACKTFRTVQILCAAGLGTDAGTASRSLFETVVPIFFILKFHSKERARIYHAYGRAQALKMLNQWAQTPGLKRKATRALFAKAQSELVYWTSQLGPTVDYRHHWSGLRSLEAAIKSLHAPQVYAVFYRHTSAFAHASDFGDHVVVDPATQETIFKLPPSTDHVQSQALVARVMFWLAAARVNERLGLGFEAVLNPHRPPEMRL